jgi:hypothetical protein
MSRLILFCKRFLFLLVAGVLQLFFCALNAQNNNALRFDGSNDRVEVGNFPAFNTPHLTVQAWVKPDNINGRPYVGVVTKRNCCGANIEQWTMQTEGYGLME